MFDTYVTKTSSAPSHTSVTVHEHKAPTDESVKLLREMEKTSQDNILATLRVESNVVNGVAHVVRMPHLSDVEVITIIKINGTEVENRHVFKNTDLMSVRVNDFSKLRTQLLTDWAAAISRDLILEALKVDSGDFGPAVKEILNIV